MWGRKSWILALVITAAGFALRADRIDDLWINGDEGVYFQIAHAPSEMAREFISRPSHPPFFFYVLRSIAFVSNDFVWLRVPSLLFGSLAIFGMYLLGREVGGEVCGIAAALLAALSPGAVWLSNMIRPYAFQSVLIVSALLFFFRYLRRRSAGDLWLYSACMSVALTVHYGSFVLAVGTSLALAVDAALRRPGARELRDLCLAHVPLVLTGGLLFALHIAPSLMGSRMQSSAVQGWLSAQFVEGPLHGWRNFFGLFDYAAGMRLAAAGGVAFFAGIAACLADRRYALAGLCGVTLVAAVILSALALYPFGGSRHSFYLAPLLALPIAYGVARVVSGRVQTAAVAASIVALLVVAAEPAGALLGLRSDREPPRRGFGIPVREMEKMRSTFDALAGTPGIAIMDCVSAYTLMPILPEGVRWMRQARTPKLSSFRWRERDIAVIPAWHLEAGRENDPTSLTMHLSAALRLIEEQRPELAGLSDSDVRVISARGRGLQRAIESLADSPEGRSELIDEIGPSGYVGSFRLNVGAYREALAAGGFGD
jgi:hypothetical protein